MSRSKTSKIIVKYLNNEINCTNIMKIARKNTLVGDSYLTILKTPVSFDIYKYGDTTCDTVLSDQDIDKLIKMTDFMVECNYFGIEIFPYIYGALKCGSECSKHLYLFYEYFPNMLSNINADITHMSNWYDIIFQIIFIIHILSQFNVNDITIDNFYYKKLDKPIYNRYDFFNEKIKVTHNFVVVVWGITLSDEKSDTFTQDNISNMLKAIQNLTVSITPSSKLMNMLVKIKDDNENIVKYISEIYSEKNSQ
jgi:hypothetical protein